MEIVIETNHAYRIATLFGYEKEGSRTVLWGFNGTSLVSQTLPDDGSMPHLIPLLVIPTHMLDMFLKGFMSTGKNHNISTEKDDYLKGELTATKEHLKDMRELTKQFANQLIPK